MARKRQDVRRDADVDEAVADAVRDELLTAVRAYRLAELRESRGQTRTRHVQ